MNKFNLLDHMIDIADNFWDKNPELKPVCMQESIETGNYHNRQQYLFMYRFVQIWEKVQERQIKNNRIKNILIKHNITETDLKREYADRYDSKYLKECTREKLIDLIINEQVYKESE